MVRKTDGERERKAREKSLIPENTEEMEEYNAKLGERTFKGASLNAHNI